MDLRRVLADLLLIFRGFFNYYYLRRMESVYRIWVQEGSGGVGVDSEAAGVSGGPTAAELRRELHTALGTAKWQVNWLLSSFISWLYRSGILLRQFP